MDTSFESQSFDAVIDKSTIDCLFCCTDPQAPPARTLVAECYRLLRPRCPFLIISLNKPRKVLPYLCDYGYVCAYSDAVSAFIFACLPCVLFFCLYFCSLCARAAPVYL